MIMDVSNSEVSNSGTLDEEVHYVSVNDSRNGSDVEWSIFVIDTINAIINTIY